MAIINNALTYGYGFNITAAGPVDSRMRVPLKSDLTTVWNNSTAPAYAGMTVLVCEENILYVLKTESATEGSAVAADPTVLDNWVAVGNVDKEDFEELKAQVNANTEGLETLEGTVSANTQTITTIDGKVTDNANAISANAQAIADVEGRMDTAEGSISTINTTLGTLATKAELTDAISGVTETLGDHEERITALEGTVGDENSGLVKRVGDIETNVTNIQNNISSITENITNINESITNIDERITVIEGGSGNLTFGDGLSLDEATKEVNVNVAAADNYLKINSSNELLVENINTVDTIISEDITIAGGPLASLASQVYTDGKVSGGTTIQEFLTALLCKEIYPTVSKNTPSFKLSFSSAPSISSSTGSLVEVGASVTINAVTAKQVSTSVTNPKVSTFTYGYATTLGGTVNGTTSVSKTMTTAQSGNYGLSATISGFKGTAPSSVSNSAYGSCSLAAATFTASLGTNTYKVTETSPQWTYSYEAIPSYYIVSNLGNTSAGHMSPAVTALSTQTASSVSTSATYTTTGVYPTYTNISSGALAADTTVRNSLQTSATFTFTSVPSENESGNPFMFDFPSGRTVSSFKVKDLSGNWVDVVSNYTTDTTVTKTVNGTSYTYYRLQTDGKQGAGNTYQVVLSKALNS